MSEIIPLENIENRILVIRGQKVLLDRDLAELYGVPTKVLNQAVKRNQDRFPSDFMFQLTDQELTNLKSQFVTSSWGGRRKPPNAFTEQGVAMLSSVLKSAKSIRINIAIMRAFVIMRKMLLSQVETNARMDDFEERLGTQEFQTLLLIDQMGNIKNTLKDEKKGKRKIGFHTKEKE